MPAAVLIQESKKEKNEEGTSAIQKKVQRQPQCDNNPGYDLPGVGVGAQPGVHSGVLLQGVDAIPYCSLG